MALKNGLLINLINSATPQKLNIFTWKNVNLTAHNEMKYKQTGSRCSIIKMQDVWSAGKVCDLCALTQKALEWLELDQGSQEKLSIWMLHWVIFFPNQYLEHSVGNIAIKWANGAVVSGFALMPY